MPSRFLAAAVFLLTGSAFAAMPPSAYIVKTMATKHGGIRGLRIRTVATAMDGERLTGTRIKVVTYYNPQTSVLRAYALDDTSGQKLYGVERRLDSATAADAVLFWSSPKAVWEVLKNRGIPVRTPEELDAMKDEEERRASERQSLARWAGTIAWVVGKEPKDQSKETGDPQLWVEKDSFLPLRLIAPSNEGNLFDLQFEGQRYYHEFPFPKAVVAVAKGKRPVLRDETQEVSVVLDAAEFKGPAPAGYTELGDAASSATRDLIRQYFEVVR